ncbi:MAG TPA: conjugative transposon protein TraM [Anaerovoracaceae bacterium]|nr:conjugative transposon protein TraM [Anaerovoracaceae bacterium]
MNKEKLIFFGAIGVVILIMVIYGVSVFSKKTTSSAAVDFTVPDLVEKDKTKEEYNNRLKKANAYQEPQEKEDLSKTANFKTYQSESQKVVEKMAVNENEGTRPVVKKQEPEKAKENLVAETKSAAQQTKKEDTGGFGIVVSDHSGSKRNSSNSQAKNGGFTAAMLEEDTKIKNQSSIVFFLLEDMNVDGSVFKKNAILYGKASENGNVFDINIYQIMNTDGVVSSVEGLIVFDEKYSRGLAYEGNLNESVREGMGQTTNETSSSISSKIGTTGVGIAANAVDNTIKAMARKKEASINLYKGYKVFIKKE